MNYRKSDPYPTKYHGKLKESVKLLVLHTTEGAGYDWLDRAFRGENPSYDYSVHFCVYKSGLVVEYAPWRPKEAVACWHAGESTWKGQPSCNYRSIGIEQEHAKGQPYTDAQIEALIELMAEIKAEYPDIEVVMHSDIAPGRKIDPTAPWDDVWPRVEAAWKEGKNDEMSKETEERLIASAQASSFREAIVVAQNNGDYERVERLNTEFYQQFPEGESGLPKDWTSPK